MSTEAAKYRTRLRDTEAQREQLEATLTTLQRGRVESIAADHGITPDALWAVAELDALMGEDGNPDPDAVAAAAEAARQELGIADKPKATGLAGLHSGTMRPPPPADNFRQAFAPKT